MISQYGTYGNAIGPQVVDVSSEEARSIGMSSFTGSLTGALPTSLQTFSILGLGTVASLGLVMLAAGGAFLVMKGKVKLNPSRKSRKGRKVRRNRARRSVRRHARRSRR